MNGKIKSEAPPIIRNVEQQKEDNKLSDVELLIIHSCQSKSSLGVGLGLVLQIVGGITLFTTPMFAISLPLLIFGVGVLLFIWGCANYMTSKGHSSAWGILGLFSILGFLILMCFPDRYLDQKYKSKVRWQ